MSKKKEKAAEDLPRWMRRHTVVTEEGMASDRWPTLVELLSPTVKDGKVVALGGTLRVSYDGSYVWVTLTRPTEGVCAKIGYAGLVDLFDAVEKALGGGAVPWEQTWEAKKKGLPPPV